MKPKLFDVWRTESGRPCFIVNSIKDDKSELGMLWWDDIDRSWNVSQILNRLSERLEENVALDRFVGMI